MHSGPHLFEIRNFFQTKEFYKKRVSNRILSNKHYISNICNLENDISVYATFFQKKSKRSDFSQNNLIQRGTSCKFPMGWERKKSKKPVFVNDPSPLSVKTLQCLFFQEVSF